MLPLYEKSTRFLVRGEYRIEDAMPGFAIADMRARTCETDRSAF
jgi:hypothetical protein